ncbi:MAG: DUF484 family protein [Gammaproteobacteria bacterium]|nr:DUF484 family protein [Gammaproteobacteria bacterium]
MTTQTERSQQTTPEEEKLADELQLISLLRQHGDILQNHPELLLELEVPHQAGGAVSLIERQVAVLRERLNTSDSHLRELMEIARINERLANSRHRIAINLLGAHDLVDVISVVLDELKNELKAEFADIKLFSDNVELTEKNPGMFVATDAPELKDFSTMLKQKIPVCGRSSDEQNKFLFGDRAEEVKSAAVIPLVAGAELGLLGLGSSESGRFQKTMGTEFLTQMGELVSAALAVHLEK